MLHVQANYNIEKENSQYKFIRKSAARFYTCFISEHGIVIDKQIM